MTSVVRTVQTRCGFLGDERFDQSGELARRGREGEHARGDPRLRKLVESLALCRDVTEQKDVPHELDGAGTVARVPRLDERADLVTEAEPAEELRIDRHRRVGDECPLRRDQGILSVEREEAARKLLVRRAAASARAALRGRSGSAAAAARRA